MSVEYFLTKGFTPQSKTVTVSGADTFTVWSPTTSTKIALTNLNIDSISAGTITFYWGNLAGTKIAEYVRSGSISIAPAVGLWDAGLYDRTLFAKCGGAVGTDGVRVNATGFEIPFF